MTLFPITLSGYTPRCSNAMQITIEADRWICVRRDACFGRNCLERSGEDKPFVNGAPSISSMVLRVDQPLGPDIVGPRASPYGRSGMVRRRRNIGYPAVRSSPSQAVIRPHFCRGKPHIFAVVGTSEVLGVLASPNAALPTLLRASTSRILPLH